MPGAHDNPKWNWDEDVLALDLYFRRGLHLGASVPGPADIDVIALSALLRELPFHSARDATFRNPAGVARKLSNFRSVHVPGTGSANHSEMEDRVWTEFKDDAPRLAGIANAIRKGIPVVKPQDVIGDDPDNEGLPEGRLLLAVHKRRERNRKLVEQKKAATIKTEGRLACEACGLDFGEKYGTVGSGFIECHHIIPLANGTAERRTRLEDLALLCANCHRIVHRPRPWLTLEMLRGALGTAAAGSLT